MACKGDLDSSSPRQKVYKKLYSQATTPGKWVDEVFANVLREFNGAAQSLRK
jgi:hypothetical protein